MLGYEGNNSERLQAMNLHANASAPSHSRAIIELMKVVTCVEAARKASIVRHERPPQSK
jgi:hypothetical protein